MQRAFISLAFLPVALACIGEGCGLHEVGTLPPSTRTCRWYVMKQELVVVKPAIFTVDVEKSCPINRFGVVHVEQCNACGALHKPCSDQFAACDGCCGTSWHSSGTRYKVPSSHSCPALKSYFKLKNSQDLECVDEKDSPEAGPVTVKIEDKASEVWRSGELNATCLTTVEQLKCETLPTKVKFQCDACNLGVPTLLEQCCDECMKFAEGEDVQNLRKQGVDALVWCSGCNVTTVQSGTDVGYPFPARTKYEKRTEAEADLNMSQWVEDNVCKKLTHECATTSTTTTTTTTTRYIRGIEHITTTTITTATTTTTTTTTLCLDFCTLLRTYEQNNARRLEAHNLHQHERGLELDWDYAAGSSGSCEELDFDLDAFYEVFTSIGASEAFDGANVTLNDGVTSNSNAASNESPQTRVVVASVVISNLAEDWKRAEMQLACLAGFNFALNAQPGELVLELVDNADGSVTATANATWEDAAGFDAFLACDNTVEMMLKNVKPSNQDVKVRKARRKQPGDLHEEDEMLTSTTILSTTLAHIVNLEGKQNPDSTRPERGCQGGSLRACLDFYVDFCTDDRCEQFCEWECGNDDKEAHSTKHSTEDTAKGAISTSSGCMLACSFLLWSEMAMMVWLIYPFDF